MISAVVASPSRGNDNNMDAISSSNRRNSDQNLFGGFKRYRREQTINAGVELFQRVIQPFHEIGRRRDWCVINLGGGRRPFCWWRGRACGCCRDGSSG